jgi:hypothetical protein
MRALGEGGYQVGNFPTLCQDNELSWLDFGRAVAPRSPETQSAGAKVVIASREIEIFQRV